MTTLTIRSLWRPELPLSRVQGPGSGVQGLSRRGSCASALSTTFYWCTGQYLPAETIYWLGQGKSSLRAFLTFCNHVTGTPHLPDRAHVRLRRPFSFSSLDACMSITKLPLQKTAWCTRVMLCQPMEGPPPQYFTGLAVFNAHPHWCRWGGVQPYEPGRPLSSASMARPYLSH